MNLSVSSALIYSLVGAVVLVYVPYLGVAYARVRTSIDGGYAPEMFSQPRAMLDKLPDYAKRASWAHQNAFEALIVYSAASLSAYATGVDSPTAIYAAIAFLVARTLYPIFYILNVPALRSMMFGIANASNIVLFSLSIAAVQNL